MTDKLPEEVTKMSFRRKIWDYMTKNELVNFPVSIHKRIPNFKGAAEAAQRLAELEEFKKAKTIKINPDKPQEPVRFLALEANKEIIVPIPRLRSGLFLHVTPVAGATKEQLKTLASMHGLEQAGKPLGLDSHIKVDLVVLGSVCVSRDGYRLGKGEGFADLEFAMMMRMGTITENTTVITTVHDCQIVDHLPPQLFKEYDVPVDIIVTPTQTIFVEPRQKKPSGILWQMLSERRLKTMQVLQQLKEMDEKDGKYVVLKEVDSDVETRQYIKNRLKYPRNKKRLGAKRDASNTEKNFAAEDDKEKTEKPRFPRKRSYKKVKVEEENNSLNTEVQTKTENNTKSASRLRKSLRARTKAHIDFSLKLSNISSGVRVRDLKNALLERGVKPSEITWQGYRGICYLHFSKLRSEAALPDQPLQVDSIVANLQQLQIGVYTNDEKDFIHVEPAKPISRIERERRGKREDAGPSIISRSSWVRRNIPSVQKCKKKREREREKVGGKESHVASRAIGENWRDIGNPRTASIGGEQRVKSKRRGEYEVVYSKTYEIKHGKPHRTRANRRKSACSRFCLK